MRLKLIDGIICKSVFNSLSNLRFSSDTIQIGINMKCNTITLVLNVVYPSIIF